MAKRAQLVCEHMENISRRALERYQDIVQQYVRRRQGVYALYRKSKLYYVGLASNLRSRLHHHLRDRHGQSWDRFSVYLTIGDSHLRELESLVLRIVKPTGNKQKGKFAKSVDIRRRFARDIRARHRIELNMMLGRTLVRTASPRRASKQPGRVPSLAKYAIGPTTLRARFKGKMVRARVRRDGTIRFNGEVFNSPSLAGAAAIKRACNGWTFWRYQRAPGDWVLLDALRR
jgi:hypothetical protein